MIELTLNKIKIDEKRNEQVIIFREKDGSRYLPVVIGLPEVNAIKLKLSGIEPPRPMTHDLLLNITEGLGGKMKRIVIDKIENGTFYAKIYICSKDDKEIIIDARPSDSVAMAIRSGVPIYTLDQVIETASVCEF